MEEDPDGPLRAIGGYRGLHCQSLGGQVPRESVRVDVRDVWIGTQPPREFPEIPQVGTAGMLALAICSELGIRPRDRRGKPQPAPPWYLACVHERSGGNASQRYSTQAGHIRVVTLRFCDIMWLTKA